MNKKLSKRSTPKVGNIDGRTAYILWQKSITGSALLRVREVQFLYRFWYILILAWKQRHLMGGCIPIPFFVFTISFFIHVIPLTLSISISIFYLQWSEKIFFIPQGSCNEPKDKLDITESNFNIVQCLQEWFKLLTQMPDHLVRYIASKVRTHGWSLINSPAIGNSLVSLARWFK